MAYCKLELTGTLGRDPELIETRGGKKICKFPVAFNTGKREDNKPTGWFNCVAFKGLAEKIAREYRKGDQIKIAKASPDPQEWTDRITGAKRRRVDWFVWEVAETVIPPESTPDAGPTDGYHYPDDDDIPY